MNRARSIDENRQPLRPHWISKSAYSVISILLYAAILALGVSVYNENYWLAVPLVLICSHFMHSMLIGYHEASHGMLRKNRHLNDFAGLLIGTLNFIPFTLYRVSHQTHHSHLGTERDEELWPFVLPSVPRWRRVVAAFFELTFGLFFTPYLFLRSFFRKESPVKSRRIRRRIWIEIAVIIAVWTLLVAAVHSAGAWKYFLWIYALPGWIAGNLQSWRKYIEHVGLTGATVRSGTRSIIADNWIGRLVSFTLLHEPYHGVHHLQMGLPHAELPCHASSLKPTTPDEFAPFPSYRHAFLHLLRSLADPRVGAQWHRRPDPTGTAQKAIGLEM
jgi:fatty acid desaturase